MSTQSMSSKRDNLNLMEQSVVQAIAQHSIFTFDDVAYVYETLKSFDATIAVVNRATRSAPTLKVMARIIAQYRPAKK